MKSNIGFSAALMVAAMTSIVGCATARAMPDARPAEIPIPVQPAPASPVVDVELSAVVTTSDDELVAFIERAMSPQPLSSSARSDLRRPPPANGARRTKIDMPQAAWTCFAQRTTRDGRAAVIRRSTEGFLAPPIAWVAEVVELPGAKEGDARAWYLEISRRIATTGHATGLVRFGNGNATAVLFELRAIEPNDTELVATSRFFKAGEYAPEKWGPIVDGADGIKTRKMNEHQGVSVFDLLRKLPSEPKPGASPTST